MTTQSAAPGRRAAGRAGRRVLAAARFVTTPLLPDDYLGLLDPLWSGRGLRARVEAVLAETPDATTLVLRPGRGWTRPLAGQWVRVGVDIDGVRHWRSYSLSSAPERADGLVTITVRPSPGSTVSRHLVCATPVGAVVRVEPPQGTFVLPPVLPERILMVGAGSGITPIAAMLRSLGARGAPADIVLVHVARTPESVIFGAELRALAARWPALRLHEHHSRTAGRLTPAGLAGLVPDWRDRQAWACGPGTLLDALERHYADHGRRDQLHVERFTSALVAASEGGPVRFARSGACSPGPSAAPLLEVGEAAGVLMPSGCRMGICHTCVVPLLSGSVRDLRSGLVHGDEGDLVQTCVSAAAGPVVLDL